MFVSLVVRVNRERKKSHLKPHLILHWTNKWIFTMSNSQERNQHNVRHSKKNNPCLYSMVNSNSGVIFVWKFTTVFIRIILITLDFVKKSSYMLEILLLWWKKGHILHTRQDLHLKCLLMTFSHVTKIIPLQND